MAICKVCKDEMVEDHLFVDSGIISSFSRVNSLNVLLFELWPYYLVRTSAGLLFEVTWYIEMNLLDVILLT